MNGPDEMEQSGNRRGQQNQYVPSNLTFVKKNGHYNTISGTDAQILLNEMLKLIFDKSILKSGPPVFKAEDIQNLFEFFRYPYTIRNDAITAVGAPSTISFLVKALYWFYIFTATHQY